MKTEPENLDEMKSIVCNKIGILNVPDSEFESKLNLLYIFLNTSNGELVNDYNFGVDFTSKMFELVNSENSEFEIQFVESLKNKVKVYFPDFSLSDIETYLTSNNLTDPSAALIVKCLWTYKDKYGFNSISVIRPNNKFGSLLSNIVQYETDNNKPNDVISRKIMTNMINAIIEQLETQFQF